MSYDDELDRSRARRSRRRQTGQEIRRETPDSGGELDASLGQREYYTEHKSSYQGPKNPEGRPVSRVSRARERQQKKRRKHKLMIIGAEVLVLLGVVCFLAYSYFRSSMDLIQRLPFDEKQVMNLELTDEKQEQMKGYRTFAIFGVDDRGTIIGKGTHADVNIICNINHDTGEIKLVSVYRDTYLNINDKNSYNKINQSYFDGGPEQAVKALNKNLDLNITDYVTFNWKAVADAINLLGGVDLELSKAEFYYINAFITETVEATGVPSRHLTHAGMNHLDGVQAVAYGRLRLMDTDFARTERQRKIISLAFEKAKKADWATLNAIIQVVFPQVATSIDTQEIIDLAWDIGKLHLSETSGFPTARGDAYMGAKGACVIPQTLESNVILLHQFLYGDPAYTPTETVRTISSKIAADSGMYNSGKPQGDVGTDGGYIPKETTAAADETEESEEQQESSTLETDEDGNPIEEPTTEGITMAPEETAEGVRPGGDASGWEAWETDENGNLVDPAWGSNGGGTRPGNQNGTARPGNGNGADTSTEDLYPAPGDDDNRYPGNSSDRYPDSGNNNSNWPGSGNGFQTPGSGSQTSPGSGPTPGNSTGSYGTPGSSGQSQQTPGSGSQASPGGSPASPGGTPGSSGGSTLQPGTPGSSGGNYNNSSPGGGSTVQYVTPGR